MTKYYFEKGKDFRIVFYFDSIIEVNKGSEGKSVKKERFVFSSEYETIQQFERIKKDLVQQEFIPTDLPQSCFRASSVETLDDGTLMISGKMLFGNLYPHKLYNFTIEDQNLNGWFVGGRLDSGSGLTFGPIEVEQGSKKFVLKATQHDADTKIQKSKVDVFISEKSSFNELKLLPKRVSFSISRLESELNQLLPQELTSFFHTPQGEGANFNNIGYIYKNLIDHSGTYAQVPVYKKFGLEMEKIVPLALCLPTKILSSGSDELQSLDYAHVGLVCLNKKNNKGEGDIIMVKLNGERTHMFESIYELISFIIKN